MNSEHNKTRKLSGQLVNNNKMGAPQINCYRLAGGREARAKDRSKFSGRCKTLVKTNLSYEKINIYCVFYAIRNRGNFVFVYQR